MPSHERAHVGPKVFLVVASAVGVSLDMTAPAVETTLFY